MNTPYDDAFRTLLTDCPHLIIPVVNELFGESYSLTDEVDVRQNEGFITSGADQKRITDSHFSIGIQRQRRYHIECESEPDGSVMIRIFEYATQIAIQNASWEGEKYTFIFPRSAVLRLRGRRNCPAYMQIQMVTPGGALTYSVPVIQMQDYHLETIFERKLWFLLPFYFFRFPLKKLENSEAAIIKMQEIYEDIFEKLIRLVKAGIICEYDYLAIKAMCEKVALALSKNYFQVQEGVKQVMGGQILEYEAKTILRQGIEQGIERGIEMTRRDSIQKLIQNTGMSLEEAMSALGIPAADRQRYAETLS